MIDKKLRDYRTATPHPAKFSESVLCVIDDVLDVYGVTGRVLDPFAGVGKVLDLATGRDDLKISCVEIEKEWCNEIALRGRHLGMWVADNIACCDFFKWAKSIPTGFYDAVVTSCTYGNRMADHHTVSPADRSTQGRNTYTHKLGRDLTANNSGAMQWGDDYRTFHVNAWCACYRLIRPGGMMIVNVSDHIRRGERVGVVQWHEYALNLAGFELVERRRVATPRNGLGANGGTRVAYEVVLVMRKAGES